MLDRVEHAIGLGLPATPKRRQDTNKARIFGSKGWAKVGGGGRTWLWRMGGAGSGAAWPGGELVGIAWAGGQVGVVRSGMGGEEGLRTWSRRG